MKPFLGLFAHWDLIVRQEPPEFLKKFFKEKSDSEHYVSGKLHKQISSALVNPKRTIGGNAANASVTLSDIGISSVLSCPLRSKNLMFELSKHKISLMYNGKEKSPKACSRPDEEPEHIIFEMNDWKEDDLRPKVSADTFNREATFSRSYRKIFYHDIMHRNFLLDNDFWDSLKNVSYLFLSGFHCVPEKHRKKVDGIADFLEKRKFKTHLEFGYGKGLMRYAVKRLLDRNCIDSIGMNETELRILGISDNDPFVLKEKMLSFLEKTSLERMSVHTREYRLSVFRKLERNEKAAEFSIQVCAAKALGGIKENLKKTKKLSRSGITPSKGDNFLLIPTLVVEKPNVIVGLGDTAAVTDSYFALKK